MTFQVDAASRERSARGRDRCRCGRNVAPGSVTDDLVWILGVLKEMGGGHGQCLVIGVNMRGLRLNEGV